jgi:hypothetical protein
MKEKDLKRYLHPMSTVTEVECENLLLANSLRLVPEVDELENVNKTAGDDEPTYFEYEF